MQTMENREQTFDPYAPMAWGFFLLAIPLVISMGLSDTSAGFWSNAVCAGIFVLFGLILYRRK